VSVSGCTLTVPQALSSMAAAAMALNVVSFRVADEVRRRLDMSYKKRQHRARALATAAPAWSGMWGRHRKTGPDSTGCLSQTEDTLRKLLVYVAGEPQALAEKQMEQAGYAMGCL